MITSTAFVFGIFFITFNVHVIAIALPCWYVDCMDAAFPAIFFVI